MFLIDDATIRAVHAAYTRGGELGAVVELRERFPGVASNAAALDCVRRVLLMPPNAEAAMVARLAALKNQKRSKRSQPLIILWE